MYDFQPLGEKSIRLLQIQPALKDGHIACILNQYNDRVPPYDALSYYWGDPKPTRKIYVNDSLIDIHEALWEFLDQMQQFQDTDNWFWTDFLCLNQGNHVEMGLQVPRMGHIYSKAERTISWLGRGNSCWVFRADGSSTPSQDLEEHMRLVTEKVAAKGEAVKNFFTHPSLLRWTDLTKVLFWTDDTTRTLDWRLTQGDRSHTLQVLPKAIPEVQQLSCGPIAQGILNILSLPYWTRVWISQEVALAKEVILVFGRVRVHFDDFLLIYKAYSYYMLKACGSRSIELKVPIEARIAVQENNASFQQIVQWGRNCKASKILDRVYGLLGLLVRCSKDTHKLPSILCQPIDYTRDSREVYWEIALTYHPFPDRSGIHGDRYMSIMRHWLDFLEDMGQSLSCPFTRESLQYADNDRATPLCRKKAHVALSVLEICRQVVIININMWARVKYISWPDTESPASSRSFWPTKPFACQLWYLPPLQRNSGVHLHRDMELIMGSLFIDTDAFEGMEEDDKYQAVVIGLKLFESKREEGVWSCIPHQSTEEPLEHKIEFTITCVNSTASSRLPCSSLSNTSSSSSLQKSHQCQTSNRYIIIEPTGWRLSLKNLYFAEEWNRWNGDLIVEY